MPFEVSTLMEQRLTFVLLALQEGANIRALCRQYWSLVENGLSVDGAVPGGGRRWAG